MKPMITAAHVQQVFAHEHVALRRFARAPQLCDAATHACTGYEMWGARFVYLAPGSRPDYIVVVLPTIADARRAVGPLAAVRRENVLLLYLESARAKLRMVLRTFGRISA
jgi:hypothetical protein